jgi:gamma-glutamyltranspeptidase
MLNILEQFGVREMGFQSAASIHVQTEAKRLAYEDRARYYADPHFAKIPVEWLNSKDYAKERAKLIRWIEFWILCIRARHRAMAIRRTSQWPTRTA